MEINNMSRKQMGYMKKIGFGFQFSHGILFGVRHYEPDDNCDYYEIHIYWGLIVFFITIHKS